MFVMIVIRMVAMLIIMKMMVKRLWQLLEPGALPMIMVVISTRTKKVMSYPMQGLAHWMSVMAEHMNHESSLHPAYMWHNGIDQKMSLTEQQQLLQKGGRL